MAAPPFYMPLSHSSKAPRFTSDQSGFDDFFDAVSELAKRANLSEKDKIEWANRYAGAESDSWKTLPCLDPSRPTAATFSEFKDEVLKCYPHLSTDRRFTNHDLTRLMEKTQDYRDMSRNDLGEYYRKFMTVTTYLIAKGRFSTREKSAAYLQGFPQPVRSSIKSRLAVKKMDVLPDEGYDFEDIHDAAMFVLSAGSSGPEVKVEHHVEPLRDRSPIDDLIKVVSNLTRVVEKSSQNQQPQQRPHYPQQYPQNPQPPPPRPQQFPRAGPFPTPGGVALNAPQWTQPRGSDNAGCMFCSSPDHYVRDCPVAAQYIAERKIARNNLGRLTLPDGRYVPHQFTGQNMRERFDKFLASQGQRPADRNGFDPVSTHFLEGPDEYVFEFDLSPSSEKPSERSLKDDLREQIHLAEAKLESLREAEVLAAQKDRRERFDGVEVPPRTGFPPPRKNPARSDPPPPHPNVHGQRMNPLKKDLPPHLAGKQGAPTGATSSRPQGPMKPLAMQPKPPADDPKFRYHSSIENSVKTSELVDRALDSKITISTRELLAASADARKHVKDLVTTKKVAANVLSEEPLDSYLSSFMEPKSSSVFLDVHKYESPSASSSAAPSLPLRVIHPSFAPGVEPECILDGGAQIVVMRKDIWEKLQSPITANKAMAMESANSGRTLTLGLVENQPVRIGPVTIYLQIQVVESAPFEVLLGRPFFDVLSCMEISHSGGTHEIHVRDPETNTPYVFATRPRQPKSSRESAVNFRS